jgi:hypothetical protein
MLKVDGPQWEFSHCLAATHMFCLGDITHTHHDTNVLFTSPFSDRLDGIMNLLDCVLILQFLRVVHPHFRLMFGVEMQGDGLLSLDIYLYGGLIII